MLQTIDIYTYIANTNGCIHRHGIVQLKFILDTK